MGPEIAQEPNIPNKAQYIILKHCSRDKLSLSLYQVTYTSRDLKDTCTRKIRMPLSNTTILIIGGSSGIGLGVAEKCLSSGAKVHIASSNPVRVQKALCSLKENHPDASSNISGYVCDLSTDEAETNLSRLLDSTKPLNHIVFTAGDPLSIKPLQEIDLASIRQAGHIRFAVPLLLGKHASKPDVMVPG